MKILLILIIAALPFNTYADTRYCGEPQRYDDGRIKRSQAVINEFIKLYPLPANFERKDYQINHAIPLVCGGCDTIENMIWMHVKAKTCDEDYCQDRHEQVTMCPYNFKRIN